MIKVSNGNGRAMSGKRLNNFGGKDPQRASSRNVQRTANGKSINNFGGKNPQKQGRKLSVNQTKSKSKLNAASRLLNLANY